MELEENTLGLGCVSVSIPQRPYASDAFSCSVPLARFDAARQRHIAEVLTQHARELGEHLRFGNR